MAGVTATPIRASTQEHLDIEDIQDDIVILKTGACSVIIQVMAINFDLLSEGEQDAIMYAYAGLLNSLTFPIQIVIRSGVKDVSDYINLLKEQELKQTKPLLLDQLHKYRQFVESTVRDNQILDKKFYVVVPFSTLELGLANTITSSFQKTHKLPYPKSYILERAKINLYPKRDHLLRQFARIGLQAHQLTTQSLLELFYEAYNPDSEGQHFAPPGEYAYPIVQEKHPGSQQRTPVAPLPSVPPLQQAAPATPTQTISQQPLPVRPQQTPSQGGVGGGPKPVFTPPVQPAPPQAAAATTPIPPKPVSKEMPLRENQPPTPAPTAQQYIRPMAAPAFSQNVLTDEGIKPVSPSPAPAKAGKNGTPPWLVDNAQDLGFSYDSSEE